MSGPDRTARAGCRRYDELEMRLASGADLTPRERNDAERHLAHCEVCRALAQALEAVRLEEPEDASSGADELAARRVIRAAMDEAWRPGSSGSESPTLEGARAGARGGARVGSQRAGSLLRTVWISAGVAALTALLVVAVMLHGYGDRSSPASGSRAERAAEQTRQSAVIATLVAGEARLAGARIHPGERLASGGELRVGAGRVALRVGSRVVALLSSGTAVRLALGSSGAEGLRLLSGELLVSMAPGPEPLHFAVRVDGATVAVTGTIFSVSKGSGVVRVSVLRGSVRISTPGGRAVRLTRGWTRTLEGRGAEVLEGSRARALRRRARLLDLLRGQRSARLSVRTEPSGARVRLDGLLLGVTPLDALVMEGQRELELELVGFTPVHERVLLRASAAIERDFELARLKPRLQPGLQPGLSSPAGAGVSSAEPGAPSGVGRGAGWRALLRRARARRAARGWRGAARAYRQLIQRFPGLGAARAAMVSLGLILLEHLHQPAAALRSFEQYLSGGGGVLAPEAEWGRIRALRALGRRKAEVAALRSYLKTHRGSARARAAAQRLRELGPGPQRSKRR